MNYTVSKSAVKLSGIVWSRMELFFDRYPNKLIGQSCWDAEFATNPAHAPSPLKLAVSDVDLLMSLIEPTDAVFLELLDSPPCCIDADFTVPFLAAFPTLEKLKSAECLHLLQVLRKHAAVTNMKLERLIAEIRQSLPASKHRHSVEAVTFAGILSEAVM